MIHVRLYNTKDLQSKRGTFTMTCPDCKGQAKVENPLWSAWKKSGLSLQEFSEQTGYQFEIKPVKYINCPTCEHGFVNCWFFLSDLEKVFNGQMNILSANASAEIAQVNAAVIEQRENVNKLCDVISELRNEIEALHSDLTTLDKRTSEIHKDFYGFASGTHDDVTTMQMNINRLRQELEQDKVIEKVFGDKGES